MADPFSLTSPSNNAKVPGIIVIFPSSSPCSWSEITTLLRLSFLTFIRSSHLVAPFPISFRTSGSFITRCSPPWYNVVKTWLTAHFPKISVGFCVPEGTTSIPPGFIGIVVLSIVITKLFFSFALVWVSLRINDILKFPLILPWVLTKLVKVNLIWPPPSSDRVITAVATRLSSPSLIERVFPAWPRSILICFGTPTVK